MIEILSQLISFYFLVNNQYLEMVKFVLDFVRINNFYAICNKIFQFLSTKIIEPKKTTIIAKNRGTT